MRDHAHGAPASGPASSSQPFRHAGSETGAPTVAIAGCGVICAAGNGTAALLQALRTNASHLRPNERFNASRFQSNIVGTAPLEPSDNPAHQLASLALREALTAIRNPHSALRIAPDRLGLVLSTTKANIEALECLSDARPCSAAAHRHLQADLLAADLAVEFDARGPVQNISNACVSGLVALMQGAKLIQRGAADAVLVVGVDHLSAFVIGGFTTLKAIDPEGCRPFDQNRRGLSPGEAGAAVVLVRKELLTQRNPTFPHPLLPQGGEGRGEEAKTFSKSNPLTPALSPFGGERESDTRLSPFITLAGWGSSNDANHMTGPSRDGAGLAQAIRAALNTAQLQPEQIDYVNVHGTGTPYNDAMESAALRTVFGAAIPPLSGLKGMLGHTLGAAGVVETVACVLAMQEQFLPGTPRLDTIAEGLPTSLVKTPRHGVALKNVLKLNTGFGGVNGALILSHE